MSLNIFTFSGRLTDTPKVREVNDKNVYNFNVAVNNYAGKDKEQDTFFVECTIWGDRGKYLAKFDKGAEISVTGKLSLRKWEGKDGSEKTSLGCFVSDYEVHSKIEEEKKPRTKLSSKPRNEPVEEENTDEDEDDVPF